MSFIFNRNAELYASNATSSWDASNTDRISLLKDFSVSPSVDSKTVERESINPTDNRSVQVYSEGEGPVEFNFTNYLYAGKPTNVELINRRVFQGLAGYTGSYTSYSDRAEIEFGSSDIARLLETTLWFAFPSATYRIDNALITEAEIDISLDNIALIKWSGAGTSLNIAESYSPPTSTDMSVYKSCIPNKFTEISLSIGATTYTLNLLNSKINISNDVSFISRDILGTFNTITDHYTGSRLVTGDLGFYLKSIGGVNTALTLFTFLYNNRSTLEDNTADITISIGGSSNTPRLDIIMPNVYLELPNTDFATAAAITVPFVALESASGAADEITLKYYL